MAYPRLLCVGSESTRTVASMSPLFGGRCPASAGAWGGNYDWRGSGGYPDSSAMLVVRRLATEGLCLWSCPGPGWEVAGGQSRHVPARSAIAGAGHNWRGGQACGQGDGVDFSLSAEQRELTEAAAAFARQELNQDLVKREDAGEFPREAWRKCAKFGVHGLPVPAELGGAGADVLTTALVMEALGYGCQDNGLLFSVNAQMWSVQLPLVAFGTPAQQRAYLPGMVSGELIGAHAMTEPESGSDALHMRTRAERRGDHYVLKGVTQYITNAPGAGVLLVYASGPGRAGRAFCLPRRRGDAGARGEQQLREDGPADLADGRGNAAGLPGSRGEPAGAGGGGDDDLHLVDGVGAELPFRQRRGRDAAAARGVCGVRAVSRAVRPADREVPGCVRQAGRHVRAAGGGEGADLPGGVAEAAGQVRPGRGGRREAVHQRGMGALQPGRDPGPRGLRLHEGSRDRAGPAGCGRRHYLLGHLGDPAGGPGPDARAVSCPGRRGIPGGVTRKEA